MEAISQSQAAHRIPSLDGWRGIAILLVMTQHAASWASFRHHPWFSMGNLGVDIFFVLSGFIITSRLLEEYRNTSTIDLRHFYIRRAFRILPLVIAYLATLTLLSLFLHLPDFRLSHVLACLFFFRNYQLVIAPSGFYTLHFWSLSIEEQFYLAWPMLLLLLGGRRALWLAISGAAACGAWRFFDCTHPGNWVVALFPGGSDLWMRQARTDARFDGLMLGCALAILLTRPAVRHFITKNFPKELPLLLGLLLIINEQQTHGWTTLSSYILVCLMLTSTLVVQEGLAYKCLNSSLLVWIGTISYSAYVWQQLFLTRPEALSSPIGAFGFFPLNLVCVLLVATGSYYGIERPCIKLGKRLCKMPHPLRDSESSAPPFRSLNAEGWKAANLELPAVDPETRF